jgi:type IV secretion system protein VirB1
MMPVDFNTLAQQCAPAVHASSLQAIVRTESGFNPYAIGVVGGRLMRQPANRDEAIATARALEAGGWNYSMGLGQVNRGNLAAYGLTLETAFDPCANLHAGSAILSSCYTRAAAATGAGQRALLASFSCYYSGDFTRGFKADFGGTSYVQRVVANVPIDADATAAPATAQPIQVVPAANRAPGGTSRAVRSTPASEVSPREESPRRSWDAFGDF